MLKRVATITSTPSQIFAEVINQVPKHALISFSNEETTKIMWRRQKIKVISKNHHVCQNL